MNFYIFLYIITNLNAQNHQENVNHASAITIVNSSGVLKKMCSSEKCTISTGNSSRVKLLVNKKTVIILDENSSFTLTRSGIFYFENGYYNIFTISLITFNYGKTSGQIYSNASFRISGKHLCVVSGSLKIPNGIISTGRCLSETSVFSVMKTQPVIKKITLLSPSITSLKLALNFIHRKGFSMAALFGNSGGEGASSSSSGMCLNESSSSSAGNVGGDNQTVIKPPPMTKVTVVIPGGHK